MRVKKLKELESSNEVQSALDRLIEISKPNVDFAKMINDMAIIYKADNKKLEYYLSKFSAWMSYLADQVTRAEIVKIVAESQSSIIYSHCVEKAIGTINSRKEFARSDTLYLLALDVLNETKNIVRILQMQYENAVRGYQLASRIVALRLGIKEYN